MAAMIIFVWLFCLLYLAAVVSEYPPCSPISELGSPYTFTRDVQDLNGDTFYWRKIHSVYPQVVAQCVPPTTDTTEVQMCVNWVPFRIHDYYATIQKLDIGNHRVTLTITNVTVPQDETVWSWFHGNPATGKGSCDLMVYSMGSSPECEPIDLNPSSVEWNCRIGRAFPPPQCLFHYKTNQRANESYSQLVLPIYVTTTVSTLGGDPLYYDKECNLSIPLANLPRGQLQFKVFMYPYGSYLLGEYLESSEISPGMYEFSPGSVMSMAFKVLSKFTNMVVAGDYATFVCSVTSFWEPDIVLTGRGFKEPLQVNGTAQSDDVTRIEETRAMRCRDTGVYVCSATNGIGAIEKHLTILVMCSLQSLWPAEDTKVFEVKTGKVLEIRMPVFGYPEPTQFVLNKSEETTGRQKREMKKGKVGNLFYDVTYLPGELPEGIVLVEMVNLLAEDSGHYVLTVRNGVGYGLTINFTVLVTASDTGSDSLSIGAFLGIAIGCCVGLVVLAVLLVILVRRRKSRRENKPIPPSIMLAPSPDYEELPEPEPLQEAYISVPSTRSQDTAVHTADSTDCYETPNPIMSSADHNATFDDYLEPDDFNPSPVDDQVPQNNDYVNYAQNSDYINYPNNNNNNNNNNSNDDPNPYAEPY